MAEEEVKDAGEGKEKKDEKPDAAAGGNPLVKVMVVAIVAIALITVTALVAYKVASTVQVPDDKQPDAVGPATPEPLMTFPQEGIEIKTLIRGNSFKAVLAVGYAAELPDNQHLGEELPKRTAQITDICNTILHGMTDEELANLEGIKERLKSEINKVLQHGKIGAVYVLDYVYTGQAAAQP